MNVDRIAVEVLRERLRGTLESVAFGTRPMREETVGVLKSCIAKIDEWLDNEPPTWRPISEVTGPVPSAWIFVPNAGVLRGTLGRFNDGCIFGNVSGFNGCIVRDWEATMWMPCPTPEGPKS